MTRHAWRPLVKLLIDKPHAWGAEIGVFEGDSSALLLEHLPGLKKLYCVDVWRFEQKFYDLMPNKSGKILNADWLEVKETFMRNVFFKFPGKVSPMQMTSVEASVKMRNESLDFVFIDANHAYEYVKQDIVAWLPKVKPGGLICGDDYVNKPNYGVIRAVKEMFGENFKVVRKRQMWYSWKDKN